jgi:hypothetical protein
MGEHTSNGGCDMEAHAPETGTVVVPTSVAVPELTLTVQVNDAGDAGT